MPETFVWTRPGLDVTQSGHDPMDTKTQDILLRIGGVVLLVIIFGVPAVIVPMAMKDVPERSETKTLTTYQEAINIVQRSFDRHELNHGKRRLMPLPENSAGWIRLINPMGRKAPGGGFAILEQPNRETGTIGLTGSRDAVTIRLPAYRSLTQQSTTIVMGNQ